MKQRLHAMLEAREFEVRTILELDPGLDQSCHALLPPDGLEPNKRGDFIMAARRGDILTLLQLGELPTLSIEQVRALSTVKLLLHGMRRSEYIIRILSAEMEKLDALLRAIHKGKHDYAELARLVASISLDDPIGCRCTEPGDDWHAQGNRFDLVAYDILSLNGLRWVVETELSLQANEGGTPQQKAWAELLRNDHPYPTWKE